MIKQILIGAFSALALCIINHTSAMAAEINDSVKIDAYGNVTLTSDHAENDQVNTLRLSLNVEAADDTDVSFSFNADSKAKITEYRYNAESNELNIYMSGTETLLNNTDTLKIGVIEAKDKSGNDAYFKVNASEEPLQYVYNNKLLTNKLEYDITAKTTTTTTTTSTTTTTTTTSTPTTTTTTTTSTTTTTTSTTTTSTTTTSTTTTTTTTTSPYPFASDNDICKWSIYDFQTKNAIKVAKAEITQKTDEYYEITLYDKSGNVLDTYIIDPATGIGHDSSGNSVNLPQTGNNSINKIMIILGSFMLIGFGFIAVKTSGIIKRKEHEK